MLKENICCDTYKYLVCTVIITNNVCVYKYVFVKRYVTFKANFEILLSSVSVVIKYTYANKT